MITFYYGSGSPPAWRVWLSLEHKELPYEQKVLSFAAGDLKKPEFLAINPRGKVPTIVDEGFTLYESVAIVEYLEQRYPSAGLPLFPQNAKACALVRRLIQEADNYLQPANSRLIRLTLFAQSEGDPKEIADARAQVIAELDRFEQAITGDFLAGPLSAADYTLYPLIAIARRIDKKQPQHGITGQIGPKLSAWMKRIEALPYFERTIPPHWK